MRRSTCIFWRGTQVVQQFVFANNAMEFFQNIWNCHQIWLHFTHFRLQTCDMLL
ncbi:hypothetical protein APA386B_429 [Acetobacter pasteurianus 386B]|nr:hypothetical protein APA386B_429 [Acetobacter pasteurianus 386B]